MNKAHIYATIEFIIAALKAKGYEPYTQLKAYIDTNDPSYITRHNNARNIIVRLEKKYIREFVEETEYKSIKKEERKVKFTFALLNLSAEVIPHRICRQLSVC